MATPFLFTLTIGFLAFSILPLLFARQPWIRDLADAPRHLRLLEGVPGEGRYNPETAEAVRKVLAHAYQQAHATVEGRQFLSGLSPSLLRELQDNAQYYPELSDAEVEEARRSFLLPLGGDFSSPMLMRVGTLMFFVFGLASAVSSILMAAIFGTGPLFRVFNMSLQTLNGRKAGRLRCVARVAVAWCPFLVPCFLYFLARAWSPRLAFWVLYSFTPITLSVPAAVSVMLVALLSLGLNLAYPARGIPDWIAGTCIVPR